jgi:hypothetical protein
MKKLAIFLAIMLIPFSAFALDTISDQDLNDVTGQAGVSILLNSVQIIKTAATVGYGDDDGANVNWINFIADAGSERTTTIGFHGNTPIMIDLIDTTTITQAISGDTTEIGTVGVQLRLCDVIVLEAAGTLRDTITLDQVGDGNNNGGELIKRYRGAATTKIVANINTIPGVHENTTIIITAHD